MDNRTAFQCDMCGLAFQAEGQIIRGCADHVYVRCPECDDILGQMRHDGFGQPDIISELIRYGPKMTYCPYCHVYFQLKDLIQHCNNSAHIMQEQYRPIL